MQNHSPKYGIPLREMNIQRFPFLQGIETPVPSDLDKSGASSTMTFVLSHAALAQLVERLTRNEKVTSPILVSGSIDSSSRPFPQTPKTIDAWLPQARVAEW